MSPDRPDPDDPFSQIFDPSFIESASVREASAKERAKWAKSTRRQVKITKAKRSAAVTAGSYVGGVVWIIGLTAIIYAVRDYYTL